MLLFLLEAKGCEQRLDPTATLSTFKSRKQPCIRCVTGVDIYERDKNKCGWE